MKPFKKVLAALIAAVIALSATACVPVSLTKDWAFKAESSENNQEYGIGVYIYELYSAYQKAAGYAKDAEGYKEGESFLGLTIKDDDGNEAVAKDWIKKTAEEETLRVLAADYLMKKLDASPDTAEKEAKANAKSIWEIGPTSWGMSSGTDGSTGYSYALQRGYAPMKKELSKYGVSEDSFSKGVINEAMNPYTGKTDVVEPTPYSIKRDALFKKLYEEGGIEEAKDKELSDYFEKEYVDYSFITVKLYKSTTDEETQQSTNKAFKKDKIKKIKTQLKEYADQISDGKADIDAIQELCKKEYKTEDSDVTKDSILEKSLFEQISEDLSKAYTKLDTGKATVVVTGEDGDTPTAYVLVKNDITKETKKYVKDNRASLLKEAKADDFAEYLLSTAQELLGSGAIKKNDGAINKYDPEMFFKED